MKRLNNIKEKGFSIVEALVAITILVTSVAGPMVIAQRGLTTARVATDQVTAFFLGQEAIEYVRAERESNILNGSSWMTGLSSCLDNYCSVDVENGNIDLCGGQGLCENLKYDSNTGFYGYDSGWADTTFYREFTLTQVAPNEISIDVTVSWNTGTLSRSINLHESMFNWQ